MDHAYFLLVHKQKKRFIEKESRSHTTSRVFGTLEPGPTLRAGSTDNFPSCNIFFVIISDRKEKKISKIIKTNLQCCKWTVYI